MITNRDDVGIAIRSAFLKKGAQQKFSLIALIITSILLIYIDSFESRPLNATRSIVKDLIYRGSIIVSFPGKVFSNAFNSIGIHFNLHKEYNKIKEINQNLINTVYEQEFLVLENEQLKKILEQDIASSSVYKNAKVIIDKNSPFIKSIIVNKGSNEDIKKGMAVLYDENFVGRVVEVNYFSSRVLLISDLNSKIPVIIEPDGYQAILSGTGKSNPQLDFLPKNHKVLSGNTVYTSGKDGIFLPGMPIGKTIINEDKIFVVPFSDPSQLSFVNIDLTIPEIIGVE